MAEGFQGRITLYEAKGDTLKRTRSPCPKCGPGVFLAQHKDRASCGSCGYTEFKKD
jgi:small subunit ribosomal protein S27Ae